GAESALALPRRRWIAISVAALKPARAAPSPPAPSPSASPENSAMVPPDACALAALPRRRPHRLGKGGLGFPVPRVVGLQPGGIDRDHQPVLGIDEDLLAEHAL